jgi:hypothetical protein
MMTKPKLRHKGEAIRLMSGEHGTMLVEDGDIYPDWYQPEQLADESTIEVDEESD